MIPAQFHPAPRLNTPPNGGRSRSPAFPPNWRWDEPLEYTPEGFLLPVRRSLLRRIYLWGCDVVLELLRRLRRR